MLDIGYDDQQRSFAAAVTAFCAEHAAVWREPREVVDVPASLWTGLGDLGVLGLTTPDSGAGPLDIVAAHEALGRGGCPGPLWQTVLIVPGLDGDRLAAVSSGICLATAGSPAQMPWARQAGLVFDSSGLTPSGGTLWHCEPIDIVREMVLLGFEPAAEIRCGRAAEVLVSAQAKARAELALAAYLAGAAQKVIEDVAAYVRARRQFRRALADFQAVAHPLADCHARVSAATSLVRRAASRSDGDGVLSALDCAVALASAARASRGAVYQAHQAYGGIGFTAEGPLSWLGSRVGQLSTEAEALWRARPLRDILAVASRASEVPS